MQGVASGGTTHSSQPPSWLTSVHLASLYIIAMDNRVAKLMLLVACHVMHIHSSRVMSAGHEVSISVCETVGGSQTVQATRGTRPDIPLTTPRALQAVRAQRCGAHQVICGQNKRGGCRRREGAGLKGVLCMLPTTAANRT